MSSVDRLWSEAVNACRESKLFEGEDAGVLFSGRIEYVRFKICLFSMDIYRDNLKGELGVLWRCVDSDVVVPDPVEAIFYFSNDSELLTVSGGGEGYLEALHKTLLVYSNNKWIFGCLDWIDDIGFKRAREAANEWARQQNRPMRLWEFERRIFFEKKELANDAGPP